MSSRAKYIELIELFAGGKISALEFEQCFLGEFKADNRAIGEDEYRILNDLFSDVDSFDPDGLTAHGPKLNKVELLQSAEASLGKLRALA